ncbi:hypothetical protein NDU88_002332 [Pleurodeles waltl]|uniref:Uncharacterized protein n=1 Tax=Pleurodeles waltl TaxID=8319 RepID=A0AAV7M167_PLEWA|nr:hypothetical protein NDU88_002332 [Pleurodeles waltl]
MPRVRARANNRDPEQIEGRQVSGTSSPHEAETAYTKLPGPGRAPQPTREGWVSAWWCAPSPFHLLPGSSLQISGEDTSEESRRVVPESTSGRLGVRRERTVAAPETRGGLPDTGGLAWRRLEDGGSRQVQEVGAHNSGTGVG